MEKIIEKCLKCNNKCKIFSETNAVLISCKQYLSKRSMAVQKEKDRVNIPPDSERGLNEKVLYEND